ncbi:MAG: exodeoxyribonuclease VII large subunit [Erysipelotrichales bacterium]|nr:exodeoxyribonuclease VII large subunit [Erysipelotrichales bacterium]
MEIQYITVKDVNERIKYLVECDRGLNNIVVKGEVSSLTNRGHIYLTIKDQDGCTLKAVLFKGYQTSISYEPNMGDEVLLYGSIEVYVPGGTYQLIVRDCMLFGEGQRLIELEKLRKKLQLEGIFDESHKLPIPKYPQIIAVVTARSGAAIHDITKNILKRFPVAEIIFFNTSVQGEKAPLEINVALTKAINARPSVIILGRGGGDKEDLNAFNDETIVRTIYKSDIPIISAVGHESDYTLVDYVSDLRASTPTDAAIKATPNMHDILLNLSDKKIILDSYLSKLLGAYQHKLDLLKNRQFFKDPNSYLINISSHINESKRILIDSLNRRISNFDHQLSILNEKMNSRLNVSLSSKTARLSNLKTQLKAINPKNLLDKGYTMVLDTNNHLISSVDEVNEDDTLKIVLKDGNIISKVMKKE